MISDARRTSRMQHVTTTGAALAGALLPLAVGMLLARSVGADPMAPVNALITSGGQRARLDRCQLRAVRPTREGRGGASGRTRPGLTRRALPDLPVRAARPVRTALQALPGLRDLSGLRDLATLPRR
ncbi:MULTISPECIES: hypothetical protein [unclassified Streptomyces]|uniref:hypothetical protein n=1 Tax=Streptomyces sp. NPDC127129 TaxID=3345373 RepID=UPI0036399D9E